MFDHPPRASETYRSLFLFSGDAAWGYQQVIQHPISTDKKALWITQNHHQVPTYYDVVSPKEIIRHLGIQLDILIMDLHSGFDINALGITSGMVVGGGIIILLAPSLTTWPQWNDPEHHRLYGRTLDHASPFISYCIDTITQYTHLHPHYVSLITPSTPPNSLLTLKNLINKKYLPPPKHPLKAAAPEQQHAVIQIEQLAFQKMGHLLISSHRGCGKSTALGLAATHLLQHPKKHLIGVTSAHVRSTQSLFSTVQQGLNVPMSSCALSYNQNQLTFFAIDFIIKEKPPLSLLLVDEAASLPVPLLQQLCTLYPKIVFATTLHGYEGNGHGFILKFIPILKHISPYYTHLHLHTPIRWKKQDPIEQLVFDMLGIKHNIASNHQILKARKMYHYRSISQKALLQNRTMLSQAIALLTQAHYQTRPSDFRAILEAPNGSIHLLCSKEDSILLGIAFILDEGPIPEALHSAILLGKRRAHGDLLPQLLATQCHTPTALKAYGARVQRIAIHPAVQSQGLGHFFIRKIGSVLQERGMDYWGCNFGVTASLLRFWTTAEFRIAGIGIKKDNSSGCHAATAIAPFSTTGKTICTTAQRKFCHTLPYLLRETLNTLETDIIIQLFSSSHFNFQQPPLTASQKSALQAFCQGFRLYDYVLPELVSALFYLVDHHQFQDLSYAHQRMIIVKVLQSHSWQAIVSNTPSIRGKKDAIKQLREAYQSVYERIL